MKATIKSLSLLLMIFASSGAFAQYKYDIGLKVSTYDLERYQVEQRFHLKSPYTLVLTYAHGPKNIISGSYTQLLTDTTFSNVYYVNSNVCNTLKFGIQRKLSAFATDVFYAGATVGFGLRKNSGFSDSKQFSNTQNTTGENLLINSRWVSHSHDILHTQLALSFGMDVPLTKRLLINAEFNVSTFLTSNLTTSSSYMDLSIAGSAGLRYQFGKQQ